MRRPPIAAPALPAPSAPVTRESFITIPPADDSLPPPAMAASPAAPGASSPLDPTVRLPRITRATAAAITARYESSAGRLIWAVLISAIAVAFTWWLVLDAESTSPRGSAKTVQRVVGASAAAQETSALEASLDSPSVISTAAPTPSDRASTPPGGSSMPVITGLVHPSAIVNAAHPVHNVKSKLAPKPAKSRATSALEKE
jgi:hypothetical protein